jgi:citrate lyase beta subunit
MGGAAALLYARSRLVMASFAAGLPGPIDRPTVDLDDMVGLG